MGASKGSPFESCRVSVGGKTLYAEVDIKKRKKKKSCRTDGDSRRCWTGSKQGAIYGHTHRMIVKDECDCGQFYVSSEIYLFIFLAVDKAVT